MNYWKNTLECQPVLYIFRGVFRSNATRFVSNNIFCKYCEPLFLLCVKLYVTANNKEIFKK